MASPIEEIIEEIEEYIDNCKPSAFSSTKIIVNRDELEGLINNLKSKIPGEVSRYQKIINNRDRILEDAKRQANEIVSQAQIQTNELISEHQIMQQAYAQANEVVMIATKEAQTTLDAATTDANEIRRSAINYTDELLANVQAVLVKSIDTTRAKQNQFINTMQSYLDTVVSNRMQLNPTIGDEDEPKSTPSTTQEVKETPQPEIEASPAENLAATPKEDDIVVDTIKDDKEDSIIEGIIDIPEQFFKRD